MKKLLPIVAVLLVLIGSLNTYALFHARHELTAERARSAMLAAELAALRAAAERKPESDAERRQRMYENVTRSVGDTEWLINKMLPPTTRAASAKSIPSPK